MVLEVAHSGREHGTRPRLLMLIVISEIFQSFRKEETFVSKLFLVLARSCNGKARRREEELDCRFHVYYLEP